MRAIDRLVKLAGTSRKIRRSVDIKGEDFTFWISQEEEAEEVPALDMKSPKGPVKEGK